MTGLQMSKLEAKRIATKVVYLRDKLELEFNIIGERFGLRAITVQELYKKRKEGKI